MTKKDFKLIAEVIRDAPLTYNDRARIARDMALKLATTNRLFRRSTFLEACGIEPS